MKSRHVLAEDFQHRGSARVRVLAPLVLLIGLLGTSEAQVTDLTVVESGTNVELTWTTGTGPYRVYRSTSPDFYFDNRVVATGLAAPPATDPGAAAQQNQSQFYIAVTASESDPRGFSANPPPEPPPILTSLVPDSGPPGTVVTISGTGFIPDGSRQTVTFQHHLASLPSTSATAIQAIVPAAAKSGGVQVCIASDNCSNTLPFSVSFGPAFQDISSIAFESGTGSLWIADRGAADSIIEIEADGTTTTRANALNEPVLAHPSPATGSGRIFYSSSLNSTANQGTIRTFNSGTNVDVGFDQAGGGAGDHVRCEGIAARPTQSNAAYFLDGVDNTVRRIVQNATVQDLNFGNTNLLTFNQPAGARFDSQDNLYISSTTSLYRIDPNQVVIPIATGFTAAAGIDLVEIGSGVVIAVADEAAGKVYLVNANTGETAPVIEGLSGPIGVAFAGSTGEVGAALYVAEPTRLLRYPDPRLEFEEQNDQKILLTKAFQADVYPSTEQIGNGLIQVSVRLHPILSSGGLTAYFRIADPPDPSGYLIGVDDDNLPTPPGGIVTAQATFDASGIARAVLDIDPDISGNNFQIEASLAGGSEFRPLAVSPIYTSWRRVYVEHDRMFRQGAWVTATSGAGQGSPTRVFVANPGQFLLNEGVYILSGDNPATAVGEFGNVFAFGVDYVDIDTDGEPAAPHQGLNQTYTGSPTPDGGSFSYLGRIDGGVFGDGLYNKQDLRKPFDDAFAEWRFLPGEGFVPGWHLVPPVQGSPSAGDYLDARTFKFFNTDLDPDAPLFINTVHLISGASIDDNPLGLTVSALGFHNWSIVFDQRVLAAYPGTFEQARIGVTAHELAHQYDVNGGAPGHDTNNAWLPLGAPCLMNAAPNLSTGVLRMHAPTGSPPNDLVCIRTHVDALDASSTCTVP